MAGNRIDFTVGFNIDKTGLNQLESSLDKITAKSQLPGATKQLKEAGVMAQQVGTILKNSFNYDFNQVNIGAFTQGLKTAGLSMDQLRSKFTAAGGQGTAAFSQLGSSILNTKIQIKESNTLLDKMARTMTNTVTWGIASGAFNKVTQSVRESLSYVEKLDKSLNDIRIVTNKSAESMQQFAKEANSAAKGLGASTRDYTEASLIYYQQGLKDNEVKARTETTLKTANVTGQSTSAVSEELTAVWNGYKVAAADTEKYVDKLAAVAADSASNLEELSTAMSKVSSAASTMGVDVDSLNAQISTIISTTRQAPESVGTALKTIYARMGDLKAEGTDEFGVSLGEVTSQMKTMGVSILDETGSMRDMGDVIEEVGTKWQGWSREQKQAAAIAMAGKRQYNNLFALFENWNQYNKELKVSQESLGTLQQQQDIYMESMEARQQRLRTQTEAFYSALIGDGQEVNNLVDVMTELMTVVTQFTDGMGGGFKSIIGYATILANLFKNQIGKSLLQHFDKKRLENYNQSVVEGKKETYLAGQNLQQVTGSATLSEKDNKWYVKGEKGQPVRLTSEQAGSVNRFEEEAKWAERIDKVRTSLSEEEYNALTNQQQRLGFLKEEEAILQSENIILKEQAENLFTNNGAVFDGRKKEELSSTSKSYLNYQSSIGTANEAAAAEDALAAANERVYKARELASLSKEEFETKNSTVKTLLKEAGYAEDTSLSQKEILKREKERLKVLDQVVKKRKEEIANQENQKNTSNQLDTFLDDKEKDQKKVEKIQGAISAASSLAIALGSVNSILDTIFNKDISGPERALQIVTQIGMVLPMLISAYTALNKVKLEDIKVTLSAIGLKIKETAASAAKVLGLGAETVATEGATISQNALNASMLANPAFWLIAGIMGLVTALSFLSKKQEEEIEAQKETNQQRIESAEKIQEEYKSIKDLSDSYDDLYKKYKEGNATKEEFNNLVEETNELLKSEDIALLKNTQNWNALGNAIKKAKEEKGKEALEKSKDALDAAMDNLTLDEYTKKATKTVVKGTVPKANNSMGYNYNTARNIQTEEVELPGQYIDFKIGAAWEEEEKSLKEKINGKLEKYDLEVNDNGNIWVQTPADYANAWSAVEEALAEADEGEKDASASEFYESIRGQIGEAKNKSEEINGYIQNVEDVSFDVATQEVGLDDIENKEEYIKKRQEVAEEVKESLKDTGKTEEEINDYINTNFALLEDDQLVEWEASYQLGLQYQDTAKEVLNLDSLNEEQIAKVNDLADDLTKSGLNAYLDKNKITKEEWEDYLAGDIDFNDIVRKHFDEIEKAFSNNAKIISTNSQYFEQQALSGENVSEDENWSMYLKQLDAAASIYPELIDDVNIIENTQLTGTYEWLTALEEVQDKMDEIELNRLQEKLATSLSEIKVDFNSDEFYDKMDAILDKDYSVIVEIKSQMDDEFETASNTLSKITEQASKIGENFIVAQEDIKELGETFPGILDNVTYLKDGTIKLNKEATKSAMETAKAEAAATIDSAIADIQANQLKLKQKREYYAAMLTIATKAAEGEKVTEQDKADFEKIIADYQSELNKEVTDTQIKNALAVVSGEADANETDFENYKNLANEKIRVSESMSRTIAQNWKAALAGKPENVSNGAVVSGSYSSKQATTSQEGQKAATDELTKSLNSPEQAKQLADQLTQNIKAIDQAIASGNADIVSLMAQKAGAEYGFKNAAKGKGYTPDKSDNDLDKLTDEFDLLENINNQLAIQESYYDRINTLVEHVYGLTKLEGIKEENKILDSQLKLYKQKDKLIQKDINRQGSKLTSYGAEFNEDGTLANHKQVWQSLKSKVNKAAAAGKEVTYEKAKQDFEDYQDAYSKYNEALQESGENLAKQQELLYQKVENNVKAIETEIQVKVDAGDAIRSLQEFRESMIFEDDFVTKAKTSIATGMSYNNSGEMNDFLAQAEKAKKAYDKIIKGGKDKIYGTDSEAAMKAYKEYTEKAAESAKSMKEAIDSYWNNMSDWMSSIKEDFDDIQKKIKSITDETKYYSDLLSLIHSSNKTEQAKLSTEQGDLYAQSAEYYVNEQKKWNKISEDYQAKIDAQNKAKEKAEEKLKNAKTKKDKKDAKAAIDAAETNIENYEKLRDEAIENAETAQTNAQQASLNSLKAYQEAFKLSIESAFQDLENLFTDGLGFNWADKLWSLDKDYITNWYDNIEREFNIKDFTLMIDMDIDDTSSEAVKQKLADFRDEQEEQLRNQAYLSEYDLKLAKAKYNVLKKEIALQEAQKKKTTLRLRRNSQGNYTYQYTSNSNDVKKAQSELNQARQEQYKITKDESMSNLEKQASLTKQMVNDLKQELTSAGVENVDIMSIEEIIKASEEHIGEYYTKWKKEYDAIIEDGLQVVSDYAEAAYNAASYQAGETNKVWNELSENEKDRWIKDSLPKLGTAFTNYYNGINKNSQNMETVVKQVWGKCTTAMSDYKNGFEALRAKAEVEIPKLNDIIKTNKTEVSKLKEQWNKVDEEYKAYEKEINNSEKIEKLQESLSKVKNPIDDLYTSLDKDVRKVGNLQTAIDKLKGKTITVTTNYKNNYDLKINGKSASASEYKAAVSAGQADVSTSGDGKIQAGDIIQGTGKNEGKNKAGIYLYNSKGNKTRYSGRFAPGIDWTILEIVKNKDKPDLAHIDNGATDEYIPVNIVKKYFTGYDTGGYTGEWNSTDGKLALLHEKELVLNKQDTSNMLEIVKSVRTLQDNNSNLSSLIMEQVMSSLYSRVKEIKKEFILQDALTSNYSKEKEANIEQSIVINADFPGVTNAKEIERAFDSLENMATQKAYSTRKR